jgi:hypothetical protein
MITELYNVVELIMTNSVFLSHSFCNITDLTSVTRIPWVNEGGYGVPKKNPIVFARKYTLRQHSGDLKGCEDFIRRAYFIKDSPFKLVHYVGDESKYINGKFF